MSIKQLQQDLHYLKNEEKALIYARFFKTSKRQYGEGDKFLGLTVPQTRAIAKKYLNSTTLIDINQLLHHPYHECRLASLLLLVEKFKKASEMQKEEIIDFYLKNARYVNNWDLVDLSAYHLLGNYLLDKKEQRAQLHQLAKSTNLWERRIAIISTFSFISHHQFEDTLRIAEILLYDQHDLIHKAVGWMLRETGKRNPAILEQFLQQHSKQMPRTMLRYAIEKFPEEKRKHYLKK